MIIMGCCGAHMVGIFPVSYSGRCLSCGSAWPAVRVVDPSLSLTPLIDIGRASVVPNTRPYQVNL